MGADRTLLWRRSPLRRRLNSALDAIVRRRVVVADRVLDVYLVSVYTGVIVGTGVIFALATQRPVSLPVMGGLVVMIAALSFGLFESTKLVRRPHALLRWAKKGVYHFQIVALIFTVTVLELAGEPVLTYLAVMVIGMIVYQAFGRIGCFMAGCCHGRPSAWGVRYGRQHAETGYPYFVQGTRLVPIQLVEAVWLAVLGTGLIIAFLDDAPAGTIVAWYIVGYGAARFLLKFLRGDTHRIFAGGLSEPQWTAVLLGSGVIGLELAGVLPFVWPNVAVVASMLAVAITVMSLARLGATKVATRLRSGDAGRVHRTVDQVLRDAGLIPVQLGERQAADDGITVVYLPRRRRA